MPPGGKQLYCGVLTSKGIGILALDHRLAFPTPEQPGFAMADTGRDHAADGQRFQSSHGEIQTSGVGLLVCAIRIFKEYIAACAALGRYMKSVIYQPDRLSGL